MNKNVTPLEDTEQANFVDWCERNSLRLTAVPNNTYTKSWNQKRKNHQLGLRAGFPDLIVLIPPSRSLDGEGYLLPIEMKRLSGGVTSQVQKDWHNALNDLGTLNVSAYICKGAEAAKTVVKHYLKDPIDDIF